MGPRRPAARTSGCHPGRIHPTLTPRDGPHRERDLGGDPGPRSRYRVRMYDQSRASWWAPARARSWSNRTRPAARDPGPVLRHDARPARHLGPATRRAARGRRQPLVRANRVAEHGPGRRRGPSRARASPMARTSPRSPASGTSRPPMGRSTRASSRPACSGAATAASPGSTSRACGRIRPRPAGSPATAASSSTRSCPIPTDPDRMWVGISAVGTFHTRDGGATWVAQNQGVRAGFLPDPHPETGQCVHKLARHPARPEVLFQQNHCGVYRSDDGGDTWVEITAGLPSEFGFPMVVHPTAARARRMSSRSTATTAAGTCPMAAWPSGGPRTLARPGSGARPACPSTTHTWASCGRPWRPTRATRRASTSAPAPASCTAARTTASRGACIASHLPGISSVETAVIDA